MLSNRKYLFWLLLCAASAAFYLMNTYVPFFSDDLNCTYYEGRQVESLSDILRVLHFDYIGINGRLLINLAILLVVLCGETAFNLVNTLCFAVVVWMLCKWAATRHPERRILLLAIALLSLSLVSTGVDSLLYWASASSNYLWTLIPTLLFVRMMDARHLYLPLPHLFIAGILLSLHHEMYVFPLSAAYFVYYLFHRRQLDKKHLFLLLGFFIGTAVVVFAPGNFSRAETYTVGLGAVSRLVKMAYGMKLTHLFILILAVSLIRNARHTADFVRQNSTLFLALLFSLVIPFLSAANMRAVFATDMFSLMLLLRLTDRADIHTRTVQWLSAVILVVYAVFYGWILYDSNIKWNIYKNTLSQYLDQPGNTVRIDDYQSKIGLIEYYTVNLDNIFMPGDKASTLAAMKYRKQGKRVGEDGPDERDYIKILPENVFQQAIANGPTFFIEARRTPGIGFYRDLQLVYDIMPYDAEILRRINEGYFYAVYRLPMMNNVRLKINYLHDDTAFERAAFDVDVPLYGRYILLNRKFKHYPLLQFEWFGMNEEVPDAKIEILR